MVIKMGKTLEEATEEFKVVFGGKIPKGLCVCELAKDGETVGFGLERTKEPMSQDEIRKVLAQLEIARLIGGVKGTTPESRGVCTGNYSKG